MAVRVTGYTYWQDCTADDAHRAHYQANTFAGLLRVLRRHWARAHDFLPRRAYFDVTLHSETGREYVIRYDDIENEVEVVARRIGLLRQY